MAGIFDRIGRVLISEDEAVNELGGGRLHETLSGTFGRALGICGGKRRWWGRPVVAVVNAGAWLIARQADHCQTVAAQEAERREKLGLS